MGSTLILKIPVIAITGSAGKTTTKEMIASILRTRRRIFKSVGNCNFVNHTARYARQITSAHSAVVLEYGMSGAGQIRRHCQIIQPNIGVVTNVGTAHIGRFGGSVRRLALAKSELIQNMKPTGTLFLNRDDNNSRLLVKGRFRGRTFTIGINRSADYRASHVRYSNGGMTFRTRLDGQVHDFFVPIYGKHHVYNALFAIAVAHRLGYTPQQMKSGLRNYLRMNRRLTMHWLARGIRVIDDSFSANPDAVKASIDVLCHIASGTRVVVLGSMLQMGAYSTRAHQEVGRYVAKKGVHYLFTFGQEARLIGAAAVAAGFPRSRTRHFSNRADLHRVLLANLPSGSTVLIKGSHAMGMRMTVEYLLNHGRRVVNTGRPTVKGRPTLTLRRTLRKRA